MLRYEIYRDILTPERFSLLRSDSGKPPLDRRNMEIALKNSLFTLTAISEGRTLGFLRVIGDGAFVFMIFDVLVHPDYRRIGIGRALVSSALDDIRAYIPHGSAAMVGLFAAKGKERFYKKLGFYEIPNSQMGHAMQMYLKNI